MVLFRITLLGGMHQRNILADDETWLSMLGLHNYGLHYTDRKSPVTILREDGSVIRETFVNASGHEVR